MSYIISYVGAGGKTSSIYQDAAAFVNEGKKVMITTTTHMLSLIHISEPTRH